MLKKIFATGAVLTICVASMTGCANDKLSAEETCGLLVEKAKDSGLVQKMDDATTAAATGDYEQLKMVREELNSLFSEAADKTEDQELAKALKLNISLTDDVMEIIADENVDLTAKGQKISELETPEYKQANEYMEKTCPDFNELE